MLKARHIIGLRRNGCFSTLDRKCDTKLKNFISAIRKSGKNLSLTMAVQHAKSSEFSTFSFTVLSGQNPNSSGNALDDNTNEFLILGKVRSSGCLEKFCSKTFTRQYQLTPKEQLLAEEIFSGKTIADVAITSKLSVLTIRDRAKAIYRKTGTHGMPELIRLMYKFTG